MRTVAALALAALAYGGCSYVNAKLGFPDDNIVEEGIERQIEGATGLDIDLTPESPE